MWSVSAGRWPPHSGHRYVAGFLFWALRSAHQRFCAPSSMAVQDLLDEPAHPRQDLGRKPVPGVALEVLDLKASLVQVLVRAPREVHGDDRVVAAMVDEHRQPAPGVELRMPAVDGGHEPAQGHDPGGRRTAW